MKPTRSAQRGVGLFDALIALVILSFGMLAMTRFQTRLVGNATDAQSRLTAAALADELLNTALVDGNANNRPCYTLPKVGVCPVAAAGASARTDGWAARVAAALPQGAASSVYVPATGMMTVTIQWTGKSRANFNGTSAAEKRTMEMSSNVN
jgi:type IV pilus assembly protein PilV